MTETPPPGPMGYDAPPTGPMGYAPPPPMAPKRSNRTALVILGVLAVAVIAIVAYVALTRDSSKGDVNALAVGDCVDRPTTSTEISEIQHQPCNTPHDGEVVALLTNPAGPDEPYPVVSGFEDYVVPACTPAFESYTGRVWNAEADLTLAWLEPTLSGWTDDHDRSFTCYVVRLDGAKLNATLKGIGASPLP